MTRPALMERNEWRRLESYSMAPPSDLELGAYVSLLETHLKRQIAYNPSHSRGIWALRLRTLLASSDRRLRVKGSLLEAFEEASKLKSALGLCASLASVDPGSSLIYVHPQGAQCPSCASFSMRIVRSSDLPEHILSHGGRVFIENFPFS